MATTPTLAEVARELRRELEDEHADAEQLAEAIAVRLGRARPDTKARSRQRAAYAAVGLDPPLTGSQVQDELEKDERRRHSRRQKAGRQAKRTLKRAGKRTAAAGAALAQPSRTASLGGLVVMTFALVLLYNLLRTADRLTGLFGAVARAVQWLDDPTATIGGN